MALLAGLTTGCVQAEPRHQSASARAAHADHGDAADAAPGYTVDVEVPPRASRGQEALARVKIKPQSPWHMNREYPATLELKASKNITLVSPVQRKDDAERYDDDALVFSVLFTPETKGTHRIEGEVDFAVCGDASCGPVTAPVELTFEVSCRADDSGLC